MSECESCKCEELAAAISREPLTATICGPLDAARGIELEIFVTGNSPSLGDILRIHEYVDLMALAYAADPNAFTAEQRQFLQSLEAAGAEQHPTEADPDQQATDATADQQQATAEATDAR